MYKCTYCVQCVCSMHFVDICLRLTTEFWSNSLPRSWSTPRSRQRGRQRSGQRDIHRSRQRWWRPGPWPRQQANISILNSEHHSRPGWPSVSEVSCRKPRHQNSKSRNSSKSCACQESKTGVKERCRTTSVIFATWHFCVGCRSQSYD